MSNMTEEESKFIEIDKDRDKKVTGTRLVSLSVEKNGNEALFWLL